MLKASTKNQTKDPRESVLWISGDLFFQIQHVTAFSKYLRHRQTCVLNHPAIFPRNFKKAGCTIKEEGKYPSSLFCPKRFLSALKSLFGTSVPLFI